MDSLNWVALAAAFFAGAGFLVITYARFIQEREKIHQQRIRFEFDMRQQSQIERSPTPVASRDVREIKDLIRDQTNVLREIAAHPVTVNVATEQTSAPYRLHRDQPPMSRETDPASTESLVREMSHSLNTPLSQIEIALSLLSENSDALPAEDQASLQRAINSVAVCKAFIQAFRYVILAESDDVEDVPRGALADVLTSATTTQAAQREVDVVTRLPAQISEYEDAFLLAVLIPLVENAIEASPSRDRVLVSSEEQHDRTVISVQNHLESPPPDSMFEPRFSTKPDHDGMGLVVVTRLLNSIPGARLAHGWSESTMTFQIELPRGLR